MLTLDNGVAKLTYTYDALRRLASETSDLRSLVSGLAPHTVSYAYDALGRRQSLGYPDASRATYAYDVRNRLTEIDDDARGQPLARYAYDPLGRVEKLTRDNGVATSYRYDMAGQLTDIAHTKGGQTLVSSQYALDVLGRRTAQTREDNVTENYSYDATSQLTGVSYGTGKAETFAYDAAGNRSEVGRVLPAAPLPRESYQANALNQYTAVAGVALAYDANGNLVNDGRQAYRYDAQNRLIAVENTAVRAEFFYDARNRCVLRKYSTPVAAGQWMLNAADSRALTYDTAWNLLAERTLNGVQAGKYLHGQRTDEILTATVNGQTTYPLADGLGSTVALANKKAKVTDRYRYDAYGQPRALTASYQPATATASAYRFLFTGREWLASVSLNDHRYRYYSPGLGRWTATDPIRFSGGDINLCRYAENSPHLYNDNFGLTCGSGWNEYLVPDSPFWDFSSACAKHDACYGTCKKMKSTCDNAFREDMGRVCGSSVLCYIVANIYYEAVQDFGGSAYEAAQQEACAKCKP